MPSAPSIIADHDESINTVHFPWHTAVVASRRAVLTVALSSEVIVIDGNHLLCFIKLCGCKMPLATAFFVKIINVLHEEFLDALLGVVINERIQGFKCLNFFKR